MKNQESRRFLYAFAIAAAAFVLWTAAVCTIDVQAIGPEGSSVGFARLNRAFHNFTGVHTELYLLTDWLSVIPLCCAAGFGTLGLLQWIQRKSLAKVDRSLLLLGGFYAVVITVFILFELFPVNCRPVLIDGVLESSYPSSTTLLVLCVMPTTRIQLTARIKRGRLHSVLSFALWTLTLFMVAARLISGVHWLTDIVGGVLLAFALTFLYRSLCHK